MLALYKVRDELTFLNESLKDADKMQQMRIMYFTISSKYLDCIKISILCDLY